MFLDISIPLPLLHALVKKFYSPKKLIVNSNDENSFVLKQHSVKLS